MSRARRFLEWLVMESDSVKSMLKSIKNDKWYVVVKKFEYDEKEGTFSLLDKVCVVGPFDTRKEAGEFAKEINSESTYGEVYDAKSLAKELRLFYADYLAVNKIIDPKSRDAYIIARI